jgi:hypothetical protein
MKQKLYTEEEVEKMLSAQRGNCYVAVLSATKDKEIAQAASAAPEPGQWRENFVKIDNKNIKDAIETLDDLGKFLDERVSDLYQVQGGMQARHCYIFYRSKVWEAKDLLRS